MMTENKSASLCMFQSGNNLVVSQILHQLKQPCLQKLTNPFPLSWSTNLLFSPHFFSVCVLEWSWSPWIRTGVRHMGVGEGSHVQASRQHPIRPKQPWRVANSRAHASEGRGRCTAPTLLTCLMRWLPWFWQVRGLSNMYERYQINAHQKHSVWSTHAE